jgi:hypothetical protein
MNEILNRNNRTQNEISFEINRQIDRDEAALAALAAGGDKKALAVVASRSAVVIHTAESAAALQASASAASRSASSVTASVKAAAAAQNLENQVRNAAEKIRKAAVYQELLVSLAVAKAAKLAAV